VKAGELVELNYGRALRKDKRKQGSVPVYGTNGQCGWHDECLEQGPGLILGRKGQGPLGVEWCDDDFWVIDTAYYASTKRNDVDLKYLYYLIKYVGLNHLKDGTSNPTLSRDSFGAQLFPHPPLATQKEISHILGTLDDKIELNRRMNRTLDEMARALFKSWFVDFDPVRWNMDKKAGTATGKPPVPPEIGKLFPDSFLDSELGPIPEGWEVCPLSKRIKLLSGGTPKTSNTEYWGGDIPWFSVKDAPSESDIWVIKTEKQVTEKGIENSAAQILPEGVTIISARGTVGKLALIGKPMAMNQSCYGVQGVDGFSDFFTYFSLRQATEELKQRTHGSVFDTITRQTFETLVRIFPTANLAKIFDKTVWDTLSQMKTNLHQIHTLATLRDTLLPKLISGDLKIEDSETLA
jgi:type I restriction enzyme S subunit